MAADFDVARADLDVTSLHHRRATHRWERTSVGDMFERMTWSFPDHEALVGREGAYGHETFRRVTYAQAAQLFWNTGQAGKALFTPVGPDSAGPDLFDPIVGRGSAYADIDGDGDLDVVLTANGGPAHLFRNDGGNKNHWLRLILKGTTSNRDAIGANVTVECGPLVQRKQLFTAKGYLSSVEAPLTFGLGRAEEVDAITIRWPSGKTTKLEHLKADKVYPIDESTAKEPEGSNKKKG